MEQGRDTFENQEIPVASADIDAVLLTHAHMDHSGKLPLLVKEGFRGAIHATSATGALCNIMLRDSAHIQLAEQNGETERENDLEISRQSRFMGWKMPCQRSVNSFHMSMGTFFHSMTVFRSEFTDVGHLLGSASIELWITEDNVTKKLVFSGDIGNLNQPPD